MCCLPLAEKQPTLARLNSKTFKLFSELTSSSRKPGPDLQLTSLKNLATFGMCHFELFPEEHRSATQEEGFIRRPTSSLMMKIK